MFRLLKTALLLAALLSLTRTARAEPPLAQRPNILWIVAENMGPDLGCYGAPLVETPHLDRLARDGMRFELAFSTAPICSPSRSAFMTGMYQTTIGAHNHRSHRDDHFPLPAGVRPITHWLADAGYFTANVRTMAGRTVGTGKTDLNFAVQGPVLNQHRAAATSLAEATANSEQHNHANEIRLFHTHDWSDLKAHQPFFAQVNLPVVERNKNGWVGSAASPVFGRTHPSRIDPAQVSLPPYHPDHPIARKDWAGFLNAVCAVDDRAGEILAQLAADGLADNTVVIFFGDNGRLEHRGLDWCYDSGLHVPLIVRWPQETPSPAGVSTGRGEPAARQPPRPHRDHPRSGRRSKARRDAEPRAARPARAARRPAAQVCLQRAIAPTRRSSTIRAVRSEHYRYIGNFMPERPWMALHRYKEAAYPVVPLLRDCAPKESSRPCRKHLWLRACREELYDLATDPHEVRNLASSTDPERERILQELRTALDRWIDDTNDQGRIPEPPNIIARAVEIAQGPTAPRPGPRSELKSRCLMAEPNCKGG